tara:strand:- start:49 stop:288 length:240 start_codon:yes stop_codon:yes gene_type:complete
MTNTTLLIGVLVINTIFLLREFIKGVLLSKRLEDTEGDLEIKILEVINLEQYMGKQIIELREENERLKEKQKELTPVEG